MYHNQVGFSSEKGGGFNNVISILKHINVLKGKSHMITSIDTEKASDKIHYVFINIPERIILEGTYLNIVKDIHAKLMSNIIINRKKLKEFLLKSETTQLFTLPTPFHDSVWSTSWQNKSREGNEKDTNRKIIQN